MKKMTQGATRLLVLALGLGLAATGWADTLRVIGSDATICSSATTLDQLGIGMSEGKVAGKINFYTPAGCSAGDTLVFTKVEMLESTGNTANAKQEATNITITVGGQNYTSDLVIKSSTAPSSLGNLTTVGIASCKLLTYNFPDVFVQAGEQYDVTFNGANFSELRCRMENTSSGTVFTAPTSGAWKPYGVITVAPVKSSNPDVGDTILLSNTATSGELQASPNAECNFALTIPATPVLPSGATINVKKLNFASWNDTMVKSGSSQCDPYGIYLNGQRSKNLKGNTTYNSTDPGTIDLTGAKIQANATTYANRLSFAFVDGYIPQLTVGTAYAQANGNGDKGDAGKGITFLHYNGNQNSGGSTDYCSVRYVSAASGAISTSTASGYYPVYEMYAEVISIPTATNTISAAGTYTLADLFTAVYDNRRYVIIVNESATLNLDASVGVKSIAFEVASGKTLTVSGDYTITAADGIYVSGGTVAVSKKDTLSGAFRGDGTVEFTGVYATPLDLTNKGVTDASAWQGTLSFKSVSSKSGWQFSKLGNVNSTVRFDGVTDGYFNSTETFGGTVDIGSGGLVLHYGNGGGTLTTLSKLTGSGEFKITGGSTYNGGCSVCIKSVDGFTGKFNLASGANQQITIGDTGTCSQSAKIIIAEGKSATPGTTWEAYGGIEVNGTLTLGATIGMPSVSGGTGTVVCNGKIPNNPGLAASTWKGRVVVNGTFESTSTQFMNADSILEVASGELTLTGAVDLPGRVLIDEGAQLIVANTSITSLTLGAVENAGTLDLSGCTSLETINFNLGKDRTVDLGLYGTTFKVPSSLESVGTVTLVEMPSEGGTIRINSALLPFFGPTYSITYADGTALTPISTSVSGSITSITYTPHISGVATDLDWDFTDGVDDAFEQAPAGVSRDYDSTATFSVDSKDSSYTGVYLKHHPYVKSAASFIHDNSSAITVAAVGTMPSGSKTIFMNFGSAYNGQYGLLLANTEVANEVLVAYNYGATVTPITTMTVPNATTARHSYIITKEDGASSTTFTVYLDGIKWKTVTTNFKIEFSNANTGIQFGSDFGGNIRTAGYPAVSDDTGILNVLRVYGRVITPAEIATYASTFPYVSPNGSASRTFAAAAENWIDTTEASEVWDNSEEADSGTPTAGAALTVTATADTTITVNLAAETQYEALTINGSSVKFQPSSGMVKVSGMTVIGTTVTNVYGAVDMSGGPMTITEDGSICFDYSGYDASGIYSTTDATTDIPLTSDVDRNDAKVHLIAPATPYRTYSLVYESGHYAMRVTPDHEAGSEVYFGSGYLDGAMTGSGGTGTVYLETDHTHQTALFPGDTMVIDNNSSLYQEQVWVSDAFIGNIKITRTTPMTLHNGELTSPILVGKTIAVESGASLTISKHTSNALTLGALTINGTGAVALSGPLTLGGAVAGTATVTVNGSVSVSSGGSIANTVSGSGTITYAALPAAVPAGFTSWTGTVVLPTVTSGAAPLNLNSYGAVGSTVEVSGVSGSAYLANAAVTPTVHLVGDMTLSAFSATFANTFNKLSGSRAFSLTADGTAQEYADGYFLIKDVSDFTGSITVAAPGLALGGTSKPSSSEWYGKIVVQAPVTVGSGATWSASGVVLSATTATLTVPAGATVPAVASGVAGYKVDADTTTTPGSTVYSLVAKGATVSDVAFDYGKDFATATVRATVSGDATTYTLTVGTTDYPGVVDGSTVTFSGVATGHAAAYDNVDYTIAATDGTSPVTVSGGSGAAPVADVTADWINENATTHGLASAGGAWTNAEAVTYSDGKATISDNRFVATEASTASRVVLEFNVCFSSTSEDDVTGEAQAAIKLGEENDATTFKVLAPANTWTPVSCAGLTPDASATYKVVLTIDYGNNTYGVTVGNYVMTNGTGSASFPLAASRTSVQNIDFAGSGTLTLLKGDQLEGYMVKDGQNNYYATIEAATQAYNSANGPYTVLHNGTAPSGWKIVEGALIKVAKGLFFMAY